MSVICDSCVPVQRVASVVIQASTAICWFLMVTHFSVVVVTKNNCNLHEYLGCLLVTYIKSIPNYCLQQGVFPLKREVQEQTANSWPPTWQTFPVIEEKNESTFQKVVVYPLPMECSLQSVHCLSETKIHGIVIENMEEILWFGVYFKK